MTAEFCHQWDEDSSVRPVLFLVFVFLLIQFIQYHLNW